MSEKDIANKLSKELDKIKYKIKMEKGDYLTIEDVEVVFQTLKKFDNELSPLYETVEKLVYKMFDIDHYFVKDCIVEMLLYYNIIENPNLMKSRHKIFITESKNSVVNKPFFSNSALEKIKEIFDKHRIFNKI